MSWIRCIMRRRRTSLRSNRKWRSVYSVMHIRHRKESKLKEQKELLTNEAATHEENVRLQLQIATLVATSSSMHSRQKKSTSTTRLSTHRSAMGMMLPPSMKLPQSRSNSKRRRSSWKRRRNYTARMSSRRRSTKRAQSVVLRDTRRTSRC